MSERERDLFTPFEELDKRASDYFNGRDFRRTFYRMGENPKNWSVPIPTFEEGKPLVDAAVKEWIDRFGAPACRSTIHKLKERFTKDYAVRAIDEYIVESFERQAGPPHSDPVR